MCLLRSILMGINFYGRSSRAAVVGHEYLSLLEQRPELTWDSETEEHTTHARYGSPP